MAGLDHITIKGFKSIESIQELQLRPINILIGANGSGKSNFLSVFSLAKSVLRHSYLEEVAREGGAEALLHFGSKVTSEIVIEGSYASHWGWFGMRLIPSGGDSLALLPARTDELFGSAENAPPNSHFFDPWRRYRFNDTDSSSLMKKSTDIEDNRYLRPNAANLPALLYLIRERHPAQYSLIRGAVKQVAPFFDDFELAPTKLNPEKILLEWKHVKSDRYFNASSLSDGTLRFICLATLFLQPLEMRPGIIIVDEPELGLHPYAIAMLASVIKSASADTQIILATQSPILLDHFDPEDILVADLVDDATQIRRLTSSELEGWLDDYSLGQLWEKNQFGGRPTHV